MSVRIWRILTLRRGAADTDARNIRDVLIVRGRACELSEHISLIAYTSNESIGTPQVVLIEVADTRPVQAARNWERHSAIADGDDRTDGCGSHSESQEESR